LTDKQSPRLNWAAPSEWVVVLLRTDQFDRRLSAISSKSAFSDNNSAGASSFARLRNDSLGAHRIVPKFRRQGRVNLR
jgi:hypothetical protein